LASNFTRWSGSSLTAHLRGLVNQDVNASGGDVPDRVLQIVTSAGMELWNRYDWRFRRKRGTLEFADGGSTADLPDDFAEMDQEWLRDSENTIGLEFYQDPAQWQRVYDLHDQDDGIGGIPRHAIIVQKTGQERTMSSVDTTTEVVTTTQAHGFATGDLIQFTSTATVPAGITASESYWARVPSTTTFTVHTTYSGSIDETGTADRVDITGSGTGTITVTRPDRITTTIERTINAVDTTSDYVTTSAAHTFATGDEIFVVASGVGATIIAGVTAKTSYWARVLSSTTFQLHSTYAGSLDDSGSVDLVDLTSAGAGTLTVTRRGSGWTWQVKLADITNDDYSYPFWYIQSDSWSNGTITDDITAPIWPDGFFEGWRLLAKLKLLSDYGKEEQVIVNAIRDWKRWLKQQLEENDQVYKTPNYTIRDRFHDLSRVPSGAHFGGTTL